MKRLLPFIVLLCLAAQAGEEKKPAAKPALVRHTLADKESTVVCKTRAEKPVSTPGTMAHLPWSLSHAARTACSRMSTGEGNTATTESMSSMTPKSCSADVYTKGRILPWRTAARRPCKRSA